LADDTQQNGTDGAEATKREVTLRIDESKMQSAYSNTFRTDVGVDELFIDFGTNRMTPGKENEMVFTVRQQVILNWRGAKRLALNLSNLIRQYEERYGEIELGQKGQPTPNADQAESTTG